MSKNLELQRYVPIINITNSLNHAAFLLFSQYHTNGQTQIECETQNTIIIDNKFEIQERLTLKLYLWFILYC